MSKLVIMDHPMIKHKLTILRNKNTSTQEFRTVTNEISMLMTYEMTRDLPLEEVEIETPLVKTTQEQIAGKKMAIIPILRAGLGMVDGILTMVPAARVGHIGLYRDEETLEPVEYFSKLPTDIEERRVFVVDPMLATGGSAIEAINSLVKTHKVPSENIKFVCLVAAPEGVKKFQEAHPDVAVYVAAMDEKLDENGYIIPGLGDAGDRIFGTE